MRVSCALNMLTWDSLNEEREVKIVSWDGMSFTGMKFVYTVFNVRES
jgi:hypothetical protein